MLILSMENISTREIETNSPSDNKINLINFKNKKIKIIIFLIILFSILISSILFLIQKSKSTKSVPNSNSNSVVNYNQNVSPTGGNDQVEAGWIKYQNDVLGIEFIYPESWGEVSTSPSRNITHLSSINKDFLDSENNDYRYMVKLTFSNQYSISFDFINNLFPGSYELDVNSFQKLLKTGDICQYQINTENSHGYSEKYNNCKDNVKNTLIFYDSSKDYYNYSIKQFFYKKLNNNYFDNLLIKNSVASYQSNESNLNFDQVLQKDKYQKAGEKLMSDFEKTVNSIKVFSPPSPTQIVFQENEDGNINTIRKYYYLLATQKLSEAYNMYANKNISFEKFNDWYNQVFYTNVYNIKSINSNKYQFNVDIYEENEPISKYLVLMEVSNNKINTLYSEEILSDEVKFGEYSAYIRLKSGKNEVVLAKNGIQKVIDSGDNDWENKMSTTMFFDDPKFSPKGTYLIYYTVGWEWGSSIFYDIAKNKKIDIDLSYADIFLTDDEKYLLSCTSAGIGSGVSAIIYSTPNFNVKKDFKSIIETFASPMQSKCSYSKEKSEFTIIITDDNNQQKTIKYNPYTNQETIN